MARKGPGKLVTTLSRRSTIKPEEIRDSAMLRPIVSGALPRRLWGQPQSPAARFMSTAFYIAVTLISGPTADVTRTMTTAESSTNEHLVRWCTDQKGIFTWARRGNKNDGANVAKKNWARVRELFGYYGYDTAGINEIWALDALFTNYLLPRQKVVA